MKNQPASRKDILKAALMGCALGRPVTNLKEGRVAQVWPGRPEGFHPTGLLFPDRPERNALPGLHGPAGQELLAVVLASHPDELGRAPVALAGANLLELAGGAEAEEGHGGLRAPGRPLRRAIELWRRVYPWDEADWYAPEEPSEGLGPVLRGLAAAAMDWTDAQSAARRLARLTHTRLLPQSAAIAVALALRHLLAAGPRDKPGDLAASIHDGLIPIEEAIRGEQSSQWRDLGWDPAPRGLADALAPLPSLLREGREDLAISTILGTAREYAPEQQVGHVQHGFPAAGLPWVLFLALGDHPPRRAMEDLLARGGETEVLAGLLAALCVARHGPECFPEEWHAGTLGLGAMDEAVEGRLTPADWIAREAGWNGREESLRAPLRDAIERKRQADAAKGKLPKKKPSAPKASEEEPAFAPPPHLWLTPEEAEDPRKKKILKAARGRRKIDWKEERKRKRDG